MEEDKTLNQSSNQSSGSGVSVGPQLCTVVVWSALSIAMIAIGAVYINQCNVEPFIPIYLIVAGSVHLLGFVLLPLQKVSYKAACVIEGVLGLFSLAWFIAGSVWVFRIYQDANRDCHYTVYNFAFGILIFEYVFISIAVFLLCLGYCCTCCLGGTPFINSAYERQE